MLHINGLVCRYGKVEALKGVTLSIGQGQLVALIGANGAGKSTTLRAISGILPSAAGRITFDGHDITRCSAREILGKGIAHCPEGRRVFPDMTVDENLDMGAYLRSDRREIAADRERIFGMFPRLAERRHQVAGTLSGGEQQMLAIARAMIAKPDLIMLDEPSEGIMPVLVDEMFELFSSMKAQGTTVLLVEQNVELALGIADRAYVLDQGAVVHQASAQALLADDEIKERYCSV